MLVIFFVSIAVPIGFGFLAYRQDWTLPGGGPSALGRAAAEKFGSIRAALGILVLGGAAAWIISVPIGFLAKALQGSVDVPALHYGINHAPPNKFTDLNNKLTVTGNTGEVQLICFFVVVLLAFAWARNWWVPIVLIPVVFYLQRYEQRSLASVVHRGHPPTTLGTYPSGGVSRILAIYGLIMVFALLLAPPLSRAWRIGLWTGLGVAAVIEAYSRWYLSKHWLTDALGGLTFGYLLLVVSAGAGRRAFVRVRPEEGRSRGSRRRAPGRPCRPNRRGSDVGDHRCLRWSYESRFYTIGDCRSGGSSKAIPAPREAHI